MENILYFIFCLKDHHLETYKDLQMVASYKHYLRTTQLLQTPTSLLDMPLTDCDLVPRLRSEQDHLQEWQVGRQPSILLQHVLQGPVWWWDSLLCNKIKEKFSVKINI